VCLSTDLKLTPSPPGGIEVCHNAYKTQRRKGVYGPDAAFFRPKRWLEAAAQADPSQLDAEAELIQVE